MAGRLSMFGMVPAIHHGPEVRAGRLTDGTKVNMDHQEQRQEEPHHNVHEICKVQAAGSEDLFHKDHIREYQCPSGDKDDRHEKINDRHIRHLLQGVEFSPAVDWKRRFFSAEDAEQVVLGLGRDLFLQPAPAHPVIKSIFGEHVPEDDDQVIGSQDDAGDVVHGYGDIEPDHGVLRVGILHAEPRDDEQQV